VRTMMYAYTYDVTLYRHTMSTIETPKYDAIRRIFNEIPIIKRPQSGQPSASRCGRFNLSSPYNISWTERGNFFELSLPPIRIQSVEVGRTRGGFTEKKRTSLLKIEHFLLGASRLNRGAADVFSNSKLSGDRGLPSIKNENEYRFEFVFFFDA